VNREEQLQWEARWALPVGIAAITAGVLLLIGGLLFFPEDRPGIERGPDVLLSIDEQTGSYLASAVLSALATLLLTGIFLYLFRATIARGPAIPRWFVYLVLVAPPIFAISVLLGALDAIGAADDFASGRPIRGQAGEDRAEDLGGSNPIVLGLQTAGTVGVAFLFVMLPLRARRVGLLSPFMGILGVVAGALLVLPVVAVSSVIQAFWLGALGMLFLDKWPGGRGPAWESGQPEPWPSAAQRRGLAPTPGEEEPAKLDPTPPEPEPVPERPASRKRRRKR
jgi:hypothetical protein